MAKGAGGIVGRARDQQDLQAGVAHLGKFHPEAAEREPYGTVIPRPSIRGKATNG